MAAANPKTFEGHLASNRFLELAQGNVGMRETIRLSIRPGESPTSAKSRELADVHSRPMASRGSAWAILTQFKWTRKWFCDKCCL